LNDAERFQHSENPAHVPLPFANFSSLARVVFGVVPVAGVGVGVVVGIVRDLVELIRSHVLDIDAIRGGLRAQDSLPGAKLSTRPLAAHPCGLSDSRLNIDFGLISTHGVGWQVCLAFSVVIAGVLGDLGVELRHHVLDVDSSSGVRL
jgi:hypothetical protein